MRPTAPIGAKSHKGKSPSRVCDALRECAVDAGSDAKRLTVRSTALGLLPRARCRRKRRLEGISLRTIALRSFEAAHTRRPPLGG